MDTLWHAGLSNAVWAVGLAVLAAVVGRWGRRPALTHGLWVLVLVKLVTPPFWSVALPQPQPVATNELAPAGRPPAPETPLASDTPLGDNSTETDVTIPESVSREETSEPTASATPAPAASIPWTSVLMVLALTGSAAWFLLAGWRLAQFAMLLRCAQPAPEPVRQQVRRFAQELGLTHPPGVWLVPSAVSPMLWAILGKPRLLLPAVLWERLEEEQRAALLVHELAHLRRRDHWVRRLELVVTGLYWWHPVVWWARHAIERTEEECCDAWVVWVLPQAARAYAEALLETVDFLSQVRYPLPPAVSGIGHVHFLRRRLAMIMQGTRTRKLSRPGAWILLGVGALVLPFLPGLSPDQSAAAAPDDPTRVAAGAESSEPPAASRGREDVRPGPERPAGRAVNAPAPRQSAEDLQNARDEVELLEVQLQGKQAELQEMETRIKIAERHRAQMKQLHDKGAVTSELLAKAQDDADLAKAQLQAKMVQVKEAQVRLNQAKRRLARLQSPPPDGRSPTPVRAPVKLNAPNKDYAAAVEQLQKTLERLESKSPTDSGSAARKEQFQRAMEEYQKLLKEKRPSSPAEAEQIEDLLQRLKAKISALEGKRLIRGQTSKEAPLDVLKLRKELEGATKEIEQYKARAEEERQRAQQALAEAEKARALAVEAKVRDAFKARVLEKKAAEEQRFLNEKLPRAKKEEASPKLKSMEDRLDALAREMEALRKEIRDLASRPERAPAEKPKAPAKR